MANRVVKRKLDMMETCLFESDKTQIDSFLQWMCVWHCCFLLLFCAKNKTMLRGHGLFPPCVLRWVITPDDQKLISVFFLWSVCRCSALSDLSFTPRSPGAPGGFYSGGKWRWDLTGQSSAERCRMGGDGDISPAAADVGDSWLEVGQR